MVAIEGPLAVVGGTGALGKGLAYRFLRQGLDVVVGSRSAQRGQEAACELEAMAGVRGRVTGATNADAVEAAPGVAVLAIPYDGHAELVEPLPIGDRILVSCVNPLGFDRKGPYGLDIDDRSAAEEAARLHPEARVVGAFHHVAAAKLLETHDLTDEHVLICGDDDAAKAVVSELAVGVTGAPGIDVGSLRLARHLEPFTAVLISANKIHKSHAGVALVGL